jgi:hypothetical protein
LQYALHIASIPWHSVLIQNAVFMLGYATHISSIPLHTVLIQNAMFI